MLEGCAVGVEHASTCDEGLVADDDQSGAERDVGWALHLPVEDAAAELGLRFGFSE